MLPCGTPCEMSRNSEAVPFTATACFLVDKNDLKQPSNLTQLNRKFPISLEEDYDYGNKVKGLT